MFAEQPSVKLCCQLCCSVFKDPVITTCGVRLPLPDLCSTVRPLSWGALASLTGLVWPPAGALCSGHGVGAALRPHPNPPVVSTAHLLSKMRLEVR